MRVENVDPHGGGYLAKTGVVGDGGWKEPCWGGPGWGVGGGVGGGRGGTGGGLGLNSVGRAKVCGREGAGSVCRSWWDVKRHGG